jgi:hypothetical protein
MMSEVGHTIHFQGSEHQHKAVEESHNCVITAVAPKRNPMHVLVQQRSDSMGENDRWDERNPERDEQKQSEIREGDGHQASVRQPWSVWPKQEVAYPASRPSA